MLGLATAAFLAVLVAIGFRPGLRADADEIRARVIAPNMLVYHQGAVRWALAQPPGREGVVPEGELNLPSWYGESEDWVSLLAPDGVVATFPANQLPRTVAGRLVAALAIASEGDFGAGRAQGGMLASSARGPLLVLPQGVPDQSPVFVTKIR